MKLFKVSWLIATIIISFWLAFIEFPEIYVEKMRLSVPLYFQVEKPIPDSDKSVDNSTPKAIQKLTQAIYYPNRESWRKLYLQYLSEKKILYWNKCVTLPIHDRVNCDSSRNWTAVPTIDLQCNNVLSCNLNDTVISEQNKRWATSSIILKNEKHSISPEPSISLDSPIGWGMIIKFPLFFFLVFLGIKLGITIKELFSET